MTADFMGWIDATLDEGRELANAMMRDSCVVEYKTGRKVQDEETGAEAPEYAVRFTTKCRIKDMGFADSDGSAGGRREASGATQIHMPWDVDRTYTDDRITITAVGPRTAARHLGKVYYVGTDHDLSNATATRLNVKEDP